jgi:hypothetical protein
MDVRLMLWATCVAIPLEFCSDYGPCYFEMRASGTLRSDERSIMGRVNAGYAVGIYIHQGCGGSRHANMRQRNTINVVYFEEVSCRVFCCLHVPMGPVPESDLTPRDSPSTPEMVEAKGCPIRLRESQRILITIVSTMTIGVITMEWQQQ